MVLAQGCVVGVGLILLRKVHKFAVNIGKMFVTLIIRLFIPKLSSELLLSFNIVFFSKYLTGEVRCTFTLETSLKLDGYVAVVIGGIFTTRFQFSSVSSPTS